VEASQQLSIPCEVGNAISQTYVLGWAFVLAILAIDVSSRTSFLLIMVREAHPAT